MLLEVDANNLYLHTCEMRWHACQLMFVFVLSQNVLVQCSVFIFSYLSEIFVFGLKVSLLSFWVDRRKLCQKHLLQICKFNESRKD